MTSQAVARSAGNDAQGGGRIDERTSYLIDGAVASYGDNKINVVFDSHGSEHGAVARVLRGENTPVEALTVHQLID